MFSHHQHGQALSSLRPVSFHFHLRYPSFHQTAPFLETWQAEKANLYMAVGQHQWCHFGVGAPPILVYFSGDWDVHTGYGLLTHCHLGLSLFGVPWKPGLVGKRQFLGLKNAPPNSRTERGRAKFWWRRDWQRQPELLDFTPIGESILVANKKFLPLLGQSTL